MLEADEALLVREPEGGPVGLLELMRESTTFVLVAAWLFRLARQSLGGERGSLGDALHGSTRDVDALKLKRLGNFSSTLVSLVLHHALDLGAHRFGSLAGPTIARCVLKRSDGHIVGVPTADEL